MKQLWKKLLYILTLFVLAASMLAINPVPVQAAGMIQVTTYLDQNNTDPAHCSLREAIIAANHDVAYGGCPAGSGDDIIVVPSKQLVGTDPIPQHVTYALTIAGKNEEDTRTGDLDITSNVTFQGERASISDGTVIAGTSQFGGDRIFEVKSLGSTRILVTFRNLVITGGTVGTVTPGDDAAYGGGGILINSTDTADPTKMVGAHVILDRVLITANNLPTSYGGGGVTNYNNSILEVTNSTFESNAAGNGSAIYNKGALILKSSVLDRNTGSALDNVRTQSQASVINTTIAENNAGSDGYAGIANSGNMTIVNATIAKNNGKGLKLYKDSILNIRNSIVSQNTGGICDNILLGTFNTQGYNLVYGTAANSCAWGSQDFVGSTAEYDPKLSDNLVILENSVTKTYDFTVRTTQNPAIDAIPQGTNSWNGCPGYDQRGYPRMVEGNDPAGGSSGCDIGAYEVGGTITFTYLPFMSR